MESVELPRMLQELGAIVFEAACNAASAVFGRVLDSVRRYLQCATLNVSSDAKVAEIRHIRRLEKTIIQFFRNSR